MTKKLKGIQYKSKQEFVDDLNLIWANCLKYNANPDHFLRRHALCMRKETEKLVPLIPDIVIRDRAEVEAEERQLQAVDGDLDGAEDSDDEPIISSRGRKAPGKTSKKGTNPRKATPGDSANGVDVKPQHFQAPQTSTSNLKLEFLRADSDTGMEGSQNGFSTPPPGSLTPAGVLAGSQADPSEVDSHHNGVGPFASHIARYEDPEFQIWKQVTKRGRALVAAERNRLFKGNKINPDEPALLRTKGGMRRWMRNQREAEASGVLGKRKRDIADDGDAEPSGETLAEGMEGTEERVLPDYYDTMSALPDLPERLAWIEDSEGYVVQTSEETLRVVPPGSFTAPKSTLAAKMHANMKTMQDTRKICTKIGVVKQMQLQSQVCPD
jgi:transcriptional activator SPT7